MAQKITCLSSPSGPQRVSGGCWESHISVQVRVHAALYLAHIRIMSAYPSLSPALKYPAVSSAAWALVRYHQWTPAIFNVTLTGLPCGPSPSDLWHTAFTFWTETTVRRDRALLHFHILLQISDWCNLSATTQPYVSEVSSTWYLLSLQCQLQSPESIEYEYIYFSAQTHTIARFQIITCQRSRKDFCLFACVWEEKLSLHKLRTPYPDTVIVVFTQLANGREITPSLTTYIHLTSG